MIENQVIHSKPQLIHETMKSNLTHLLSLIGLVIVTATTAIAQDSEPAPPTAPPAPPPPPVADLALPEPPQASSGTRRTVVVKKGPAQVSPDEKAIDLELARVSDEISVIQSRGGRSGRTLVVPATTVDPTALAETETDLNIMARILEKAVGSKRGKSGRAMGIPVDVTVFGAPAALRNLYLEGHGALFFVNVPYPLVPPPEKKESDEPAKKAEDSEWEAAKNEVYGTSAPGGLMADVLREVRVNLGDPPQEYDSTKVEKLKRELTESLMNATHIRQLKPDETITVIVTGSSGGAGAEKVVQRRIYGAGGAGGGYGGGAGGVVIASSDDRPAHVKSGESVMVIRARKSDAEAFYHGKSDFETFLKKVSVLVY
jgi:hypothetical protein